MRLTDYTDYCLRTLMYLAAHRDKLVTIQEIAEAYGISRSHLMKVAHQLGQSGVIETVRGRGGGLRLGREPEEINIGSVVRSTEPDFAMVACFGSSEACTINSFCELKKVLRSATEAYLHTLGNFTLADLQAGSSKLRKLGTVRVVRREKPGKS